MNDNKIYMRINIVRNHHKNLFIRLFSVCVMFLSFSCSEDDTTNMRKYGGEMTVNINGDDFTIKENSIYVYQGTFSFQATSADAGMFEVSISTGIAETTYQMGNWQSDFRYRGSSAEAGVFTITEINEQNKTMSGTYDVTVPKYGSSEKYYLENGVFTNVPYVVQHEGNGNVHGADVDGFAFYGGLKGNNSSSFSYESGHTIVEVRFPYSNTPVEYKIEEFSDSFHGVKYIDGLYTYKSTSGIITITVSDPVSKKLEGTFSAEVESVPVSGVTKQITNGKFSYTYE